MMIRFLERKSSTEEGETLSALYITSSGKNRYSAFGPYSVTDLKLPCLEGFSPSCNFHIGIAQRIDLACGTNFSCCEISW